MVSRQHSSLLQRSLLMLICRLFLLVYTVTHDGADITAATTIDGSGTVSIDLSKVEPVSGAAVSGSAVIYRTNDWSAILGAGTYTFTLYKVVANGTNKNFAYESSTSFTVTCDTGSYAFVKRISEVAKYTSNNVEFQYIGTDPNTLANQQVLRNCFAINGTNGQNTGNNNYIVTAIDADGYVYVEKITFYEEVETGVYASYDVYVNVSLAKPQ